MANKEHRRVKRTYVGRRISTDRKLCHFWLNEGKSEEAITGHAKLDVPAKIGEVWEFVYASADSYYIRGVHAPQPVGWHNDREAILRWEANDTVADHENAQLRAQKRLKARLSEYRQRCAPLREMAAQLTNRHDVEQFVDAVSGELWKAYYEGGTRRAKKN